MKECQNNMAHQRPFLLRCGLSSIKLKRHLEENKLGMTISPQEAGENDRII